MSTATGAENWKQIARTGSVAWPQVATKRPERGVAFHSQRGALAWNPQTGETRRLLPEGVGSGFGLLSPDGEWFYFFKDTKGNEKGHYVRFRYDGTGEIESLTPDFAPYSSSLTPFPLPIVSLSALGSRIAFIFVDSDGYHLCSLELAADGTLGKPTILHEGKPLLRGPILSADGAVCVVCTNERTGKQQYDLLALDSGGDELARWKGAGPTSLETTAFSPISGDYRLLCTSDDSGVKRPLLWDVAQGEAQLLLTDDQLAGEVVPLCWSPDGTKILLCQSLSAAHQLYIYDTRKKGDPISMLLHPEGTITFFGGLGATLSNDGVAAVLFSSAQQPRQLMQFTALGESRVVLSGGEATQGTTVRSVTFPSSDGVPVQGWLATPEGTGPFPTVIDVHGGPHGVTNQAFGMGAPYLENGFAYLSVNYRGSTTFGREFLQKIWGDVGHWELEDIIAAHAFLVREGIADPKRVVITGGSYGGYLTLLALGKCPELWAAGVAIVAIANNALTYEDSSPLLQGIMKASFQSTPTDTPELWERSSPHTYAEHIAAPILVIQGKNDTRCPRRQMEVYEAHLKELGKEIEVLWFDAGHGVGNIDQAIGFMEHTLAFLKKAVG